MRVIRLILVWVALILTLTGCKFAVVETETVHIDAPIADEDVKTEN